MPPAHEPGGGTPPHQHPAATDPDETAALIDQLAAERDAAATQRDEFSDKWKRSLADFQNYQRRALQNEQESRRQGVTAVLQSVLPILDHLDLALAHDAAASTSDQIIEGVRAIRAELLKALETHGVRLLNPRPNSEFDPQLHQAIVNQPIAPGQEPAIDHGNIVTTLQPGYMLGDRIIRPAKVIVAAAPST